MLLIIAAAPLESFLLRRFLKNITPITTAGYTGFSGTLGAQKILLAHSGIGQVAMAMQLTRLLGQFDIAAVFLCGCGGSYPGSGLQIGDLALAKTEIFGDLGVFSGGGFIPLQQLNIPEQEELAPICRQEIPLSEGLLNWAKQSLPGTLCGTFVTVNCCSGTSLLSEQLAERTGGICENMEGAAAAQVCAEFKVPLLEIRGISNPTGTQDPGKWDLRRGAETAQQAVIKLVEYGLPEGLT